MKVDIILSSDLVRNHAQEILYYMLHLLNVC